MQHGNRHGSYMKKTRDKARETALDILNSLDNSQMTLDTIIDSVFSSGQQSKLDKAFIYSLVYGVLRWRSRLDWIIKHFSHTKPDKIDPKIFNILRLGLFQMMYLTRVPISAAVNTSVELAKTVTDIRIVKYVNALLRKASVEYEDVDFPDFQKYPVASIAASHAFPEWLVQRWVTRFGPHETRKLCEAFNTIPPITVRTNSLKTDRDSLIRLLSDEAVDVQATPHSSDGVSFYHPKLPVASLAAFHKGWFQVQDEAAQLVSCFLNPQPGETVLDACAGLGGKTGHIAQLMSNQGRIIAMDHQKQKLSQLRSEMMHLGISIVTTNSHDLNTPFEKDPSRTFDRILLDAPCSGLGVLRRNPDAKWAFPKMNLAHYQHRQTTFLQTLAPMVKIGGILQYVVCSLEPEENEQVVAGFIDNHQNFMVHKSYNTLSETVQPFVDENGFFRTYPHTSHMDGFFSVRFKRMQ
jgi:16S rRNA (cytosine967-C5)-methyltransferase